MSETRSRYTDLELLEFTDDVPGAAFTYAYRINHPNVAVENHIINAFVAGAEWARATDRFAKSQEAASPIPLTHGERE